MTSTIGQTPTERADTLLARLANGDIEGATQMATILRSQLAAMERAGGKPTAPMAFEDEDGNAVGEAWRR